MRFGSVREVGSGKDAKENEVAALVNIQEILQVCESWSIVNEAVNTRCCLKLNRNVFLRTRNYSLKDINVYNEILRGISCTAFAHCCDLNHFRSELCMYFLRFAFLRRILVALKFIWTAMNVGPWDQRLVSASENYRGSAAEILAWNEYEAIGHTQVDIMTKRVSFQNGVIVLSHSSKLKLMFIACSVRV